jgi:hypothetical protein
MGSYPPSPDFGRPSPDAAEWRKRFGEPAAGGGVMQWKGFGTDLVPRGRIAPGKSITPSSDEDWQAALSVISVRGFGRPPPAHCPVRITPSRPTQPSPLPKLWCRPGLIRLPQGFAPKPAALPLSHPRIRCASAPAFAGTPCAQRAWRRRGIRTLPTARI